MNQIFLKKKDNYVLKCYDTHTRKLAVEKKFSNQSEFKKELDFNLSLNQSYFINVVAFDEKNLTIYFEDAGDDLELQSQNEQFSEDEVLSIFKGFFRCLTTMHKNNICHGDIKLDNLVINPRTNLVSIIDFGLTEKLNNTGVSFNNYGTCFYIAPESYTNNSHSLASDIYAAGICLYTLLCNEFPYDISSQQSYIIDQISKPITSQNLISHGITAKTSRVIEAMLSINPEDRPTVSECVSMLYE